MKLSYSWLCEYVDLDGLSPDEVKDKLTMGAFEVEEVSCAGPDLTGPVVVGEILDIRVHPNADKIRLTKVRIKGGDDPLEIVCGAQNIEVGQRIPVALPGAIVLNRKTGDKLEIKASEIRGVHSNGMLCSPSELGITNGDSEGILVLSKPGENGLELGTDIIEHLSLKPDYIFHVAPRSNRGDALSVYGLAREVAAITERPLKKPDWQLKEEELSSKYPNFKVNIENSDDCSYFSIRLIEGIEVGPSPSWLISRLESLGLRPVNNVVDITNFVMLEFGQPLHAYDLDKVKGNAINVRRAHDGEKLVSLDGKQRDLSGEVLAITDSDGVIGLAGIMGGKDSEISESSVNIALEAAAFSPARVRRGGRLIGISSDSSLRFERGVDVESVKRASDRAAFLIQTICGQNVKVRDFVQAGNNKSEPLHVSLRLSQVKRLLDIDMTKAQAAAYLKTLEFELVKEEEDKITVSVPSFRRQDVTREIDLIEEVCRLFGYDNLPEAMPSGSIMPVARDRLLDDVRKAVTAQGLSEAWLSSLRCQLEASDPRAESAVRVLNPLSKDHQELRQSLIPGLIEAMKYNHDRNQKNVWLFETGRTYQKAGPEDKWGTGVEERFLVAGLIQGSLAQQTIKSTKVADKISSESQLQENTDFFRMKGVLENMLGASGVPIKRLRYFRPKEQPSYLHPFRVCQVGVGPTDKFPKEVEGKHEERLIPLGYLGEVHPAFLTKNDLKEAAFVFELDLDQIAKARAGQAFKEPASTPSVTRDLTVDLDCAISNATVETVIEASSGSLLTDLELVSVYQLDAKTHSLSYRLTFQDREKTLTSEELDKSLAKVREAMVSRLKATFRA